MIIHYFCNKNNGMSNYYQDKTVIVTGASSGIGEQLVRILAQKGASIVLCARSEDKMKEIVQSIALPEEKYLILAADFSKQPNFASSVNQIIHKFGQIDILINNAGIAQKSLVQETLEVVERKVMEVNYFAAVNFSKAVLPHFIEKKRGHIVAISSILGEIGLPFVAPYCASKHALNGYFESMSYDVEKLGIQVSVVSPGFIKTDITKKSLTGSGAEYAENSVAQEKGMDPHLCAKKILKELPRKKMKSDVGGLEILMPKFAFFLPRIFRWLMRKMHKI